MPKNVWSGTTPTSCEICGGTLAGEQNAFVDGKTAFGPWAMMCLGCHRDHGGQLGAGHGQKYVLDAATKEWVKSEK
jgi:hypothetical protein